MKRCADLLLGKANQNLNQNYWQLLFSQKDHPKLFFDAVRPQAIKDIAKIIHVGQS